MDDKIPILASSPKRWAKKLRTTGIAVLVLGIVSAGIIYWLGTRSPDMSDELSMAGYDKPVARQMGMLYGKQGKLIEDFTGNLKQPGTQAAIIIAVAALVAGGCFYFARLHDYD